MAEGECCGHPLMIGEGTILRHVLMGTGQEITCNFPPNFNILLPIFPFSFFGGVCGGGGGEREPPNPESHIK